MNYLSDICSLCLIRSQNLQNMLSQDEDGIVVEEKLTVFFLELINFKPNIPKYVCDNCLENISYIYKFRLKCLENLKTLNYYLQKSTESSFEKLPVALTDIKCEKEEIEFKENDEIKFDMIKVETNINNQANDVEKNYFGDSEIADKDTANEIDKQLGSGGSYLPFHENDPLEDNIVVKKEYEDDNFEMYNEDNIGQDCNNETNYYATNIEQSEQPLPVAVLMQEVPETTGKPHLKKKRYECEVCHKSLLSLAKLSKHKFLLHESDRTFECNLCDEKFTLKNDLRRHKQTHIGPQSFECRVCNAVFRHKNTLVVHLRKHNGEKPYSCEFCDYRCSYPGGLTNHLRTHYSVKMIKCEFCDAKFEDRECLVVHRRVHIGERPKCNFCDATFKNINALRVHACQQSGAKPFKCNLCEKWFKKASGLKEHSRVHTGIKPYQCKICNVKFRHTSTLNRHLETHA